jgi:hypothetical protein
MKFYTVLESKFFCEKFENKINFIDVKWLSLQAISNLIRAKIYYISVADCERSKIRYYTRAN